MDIIKVVGTVAGKIVGLVVTIASLAGSAFIFGIAWRCIQYTFCLGYSLL